MSKKDVLLLECISCHHRYTPQEAKMLPKERFNIGEYKIRCYCKGEALRMILIPQ